MTPDEPSKAPREIIDAGPYAFAFVDEGDGPCVVAVHGLPGSVRDFRWMAPCLTEHVRFVRLDMPGFGETSVELGWTSPTADADHVVRVMDHLDVDRAILVSHSYAATRVVAAAVEHPERVAGLALLSPIGFGPHRGLRNMPSLDLVELGIRTPLLGWAILRVLGAISHKFGFPNATGTDIKRTIIGLNRLDWSRYEERVRQVTQPVLCAWAKDDELIESEISRQVADALSAERLVFESGGHNIQKSRAVEISEAVVDLAEQSL